MCSHVNLQRLTDDSHDIANHISPSVHSWSLREEKSLFRTFNDTDTCHAFKAKPFDLKIHIIAFGI